VSGRAARLPRAARMRSTCSLHRPLGVPAKDISRLARRRARTALIWSWSPRSTVTIAQTIYRRRNHKTLHRLVIWRVTEKTARNGAGVDEDAAKIGGGKLRPKFRPSRKSYEYLNSVSDLVSKLWYRSPFDQSEQSKSKIRPRRPAEI
jgi:hypothetical protein